MPEDNRREVSGLKGYLSLVLHAHLPFVRHPEHERFLEENWLFEAITETYLPLLQLLEGWRRDGLSPRLTLTLTPTLCSMLQDPLLQDRYERHLEGAARTGREGNPPHPLGEAACTNWPCSITTASRPLRDATPPAGGDLVGAFRQFQEAGMLEIITSAATHALLPLLADHPPSLRAQVLVARDHYRSCFGREPRGIWLPECAYAESLEDVLQEANLRWFVTDTHGILHARPAAALRRCLRPSSPPTASPPSAATPIRARQVWSRHEGYPGDPRYRDFYRDIGFDLDLDYVKPHLPAPGQRGFTGIKYHRITGSSARQGGL